MPVADDDRAPTLDDLQTHPATALFLERAAALDEFLHDLDGRARAGIGTSRL